MFTVQPKNIFYCYGVYQKKFEALTHIKFIHGLPETFDDFFGCCGADSSVATAEEPQQQQQQQQQQTHNLLIIDDLQDEVSNSRAVEQLFTRESHHRNLSIIYINQNLFYQGKHSRTIALNTHYTVLFRNPRAASQLRTLRSQTGLKHLEEIYNDVMKNDQFGYLLIDLSPFSTSRHKLRTHIFPSEDLIVYN